MRALDVLDEIEKTSGKNDKIALLKANVDNQELAFLLDAALNFKRKFHIKKLDESVGVQPYHPYGDIYQGFDELLRKLETRELTGHEAMRHVNGFLAMCDEQEKLWFTRVLRKDLRSGFSISSANKAGFNIPLFDVMLAKDGKKCKKLNEIISKGVWVSPKLDGYRCIAVCDHGDVTLYSRNGTIYENFPAVREALSETSKNDKLVLDGEIMSDTFNSMQQNAFASKRRTQVGDVQYHVFGYIPWDEWQTEQFVMKTDEREAVRGAWYNVCVGSLHPVIKRVCQHQVTSVDEVLRLEREYIEQGYEGAMVLPNIPYFKGKKSNRLLKFKTMESQDCEIVGVYEGQGKYVGSLGGIHLLQEDGSTKCDCGSGFSDEERQQIWNDPDSVLGRICEVKYQELTDDGVMRFPIFLRFREDKE